MEAFQLTMQVPVFKSTKWKVEVNYFCEETIIAFLQYSLVMLHNPVVHEVVQLELNVQPGLGQVAQTFDFLVVELENGESISG